MFVTDTFFEAAQRTRLTTWIVVMNLKDSNRRQTEIRRNGTSEDWNVFGQTLDRYASVHSQFLDLTPDNFVLK